MDFIHGFSWVATYRCMQRQCDLQVVAEGASGIKFFSRGRNTWQYFVICLKNEKLISVY